MGPIVDRTKENLTTTDNGIIMARLKLIRAAKALAEKGILPPGRDIGRSAGAFGGRCSGSPPRLSWMAAMNISR